QPELATRYDGVAIGVAEPVDGGHRHHVAVQVYFKISTAVERIALHCVVHKAAAGAVMPDHGLLLAREQRGEFERAADRVEYNTGISGDRIEMRLDIDRGAIQKRERTGRQIDSQAGIE